MHSCSGIAEVRELAIDALAATEVRELAIDAPAATEVRELARIDHLSALLHPRPFA